MSEDTNTKTKTIIRRVVKKDESFLSKHWQAGLVVLSLAVSGVVAWKVFNPRKNKQIPQQEQLIQQILAQQQQIQALQQETPQLVGDPSQFIPIPGQQMNGNGHANANGNGHHLSNLPLIPVDISQQRRPAISSWAEKMIQREQFKQIPTFTQPPPMPMQMQPQQRQYGQSQTQPQQQIPSAPPLQRPPLPGQSVSNEDIL